ncbi:HOT13 [Candida pseudojiufengensis]|uniref:HOT13 n=1 Tax=Candida pseudojiufengensis TaxID=497109 RepID=UPI0022243B81|nr:HOT13 [Candida pseudojiufengensis]KAI5959805.1 HOT13 [Candida pseudojiufengensis]
MTKVINTTQKVNDQITIKGQLVDNQTRCIHYHTPVDLIAIKFKCCPKLYYPCFKCHEELNNHSIEKYDIKDKTEEVIICGNCFNTMTIENYINCNSKCPYCKSIFNSKCSLHYDLYFIL